METTPALLHDTDNILTDSWEKESCKLDDSMQGTRDNLMLTTDQSKALPKD